MNPVESIKPLEALNRIVEIASSYIVSQIFFTACSLGLFEELSKGPSTAEDLSQRINIHPNGCRRLLAALAHLGLVERQDGLYCNSELGNFCTSKAPVPLEPLSMWGNPLYHMAEFLPDALREFSPRWQQALGSEESMASIYKDPVFARRFAQFMNAYSIPEGQEIAERFDFSPYRCVLDVAGGGGGISIQILLRYPHLHGIVMDVAPLAEEYIQASGLTGRFTIVTADVFGGPYPSGADVITLGHVLVDWGDDNCRKILRNCFEALPSKGVLLVIESVLNNDFSGKKFAMMLDILLLLLCEPGARERTEEEHRSLLEEAGFQSIEVIRLGGPRDLIVARKP